MAHPPAQSALDTVMAGAEFSRSGGSGSTSGASPQRVTAYGTVDYTDPITGVKSTIPKTEAAMLKAEAEMRLDKEFERRNPDPDKAPEGQEFYDDPSTPTKERTLLTPLEAAIRRKRDSSREGEEYDRRYPKPVVRLSDIEKLPIGSLWADLVDPDPIIGRDRVIAELRRKGYSDEEIRINEAIERRSIKPTKNAIAMQMFGKAYKDLTIVQQIAVDDELDALDE